VTPYIRYLSAVVFSAVLGTAVQAATIEQELATKGFALAVKHTNAKAKELAAYTDADLVNKLSMGACTGEFEPVTVTIIAGKDLTGVTVTVENVATPNGAAIPASAFDIRYEVGEVTGGGQAESARELLYPALKPVDIKKGTNLRFWLTVHVPENSPAGMYTGKVVIRGNGISADLPLELKVYGFKYGKLPGHDAFMVGLPDELVYYQDCADHGMTAICSSAGATIQNNPDGSVELPELDKNLKMAQQVGLGDTFYAYCTFEHTSKVKNSSHILEHREYLHPARMLKAAVAYRDKHLKEGTPEIIWYIFDEPGKGDVTQLGPLRNRICQDIYTQVAEIPGVRTYLTLGPEDAEAFGKVISVHCYGGFPTPEEIEATHKCGALASRYSNDISMGTDPLFSRYAMGFFPWRCGFDSSTSWTYPVMPGSLGEDGKPLIMTVWEGIREGVDDWYYALTLEGLIKKANASGDAAKSTAAEAQKYLDDIKKAIDPYKPQCPWSNGGELDAKRAGIAAYIEKLVPLVK
jgi:hypothetical protein